MVGLEPNFDRTNIEFGQRLLQLGDMVLDTLLDGTEAVDALTQRGLSDPLKGLEYTLLDASFAFFRQRSVTQAHDAGYDRFKISGMFASDCAGCARLNHQITTGAILDDLPPHDCDRQACGLGLMLNIDFVQELVDRETAKHVKKQGVFARLFGR